MKDHEDNKNLPSHVDFSEKVARRSNKVRKEFRDCSEKYGFYFSLARGFVCQYCHTETYKTLYLRLILNWVK